MKNIMHIAYRSSDLFAEQVTTSIASILHNTTRDCKFYVFGNNLGNEQKENMLSLKNNFPELDLCFVDFYDYPYPKEIDFIEVPLPPYWQLFAPWIFPDIDKILIMCGDTVIDGDIGELWDLDIGENYCALAPEFLMPDMSLEREVRRHKLLELKDGQAGFNFGVILASLDNIRRDYTVLELYNDIVSKKRLFDENNCRWVLAQDYANTLKHKVVMLHPKWNFGAGYLASENLPDEIYEEWLEAYKSPKVIHYSYTFDKPAFLGNINIRSRFIEKYFEYKTLTPYADVIRDKERVERYNYLQQGMIKGYFLRERMAEHLQAYNVPILEEFVATLVKRPFNKPKIAVWGRSRFIKQVIVELAMQGLEPDLIVDGYSEHQGLRLFKWNIENPEVLKDNSDKYGVIIATMNLKPDIEKALQDYGYKSGDYLYAFGSAMESSNMNLTIANDWHYLVKW